MILIALRTMPTRSKRKVARKPEIEREPRSPSPENLALSEYRSDEQAYYRKLDRETRQRVAQTENVVYELNEQATPLRFRVLMSEVDERVKALAIRKVESLASMDGSSYAKVEQWVEGLCRLPIGKYRRLPIAPDAPQPEVARFLEEMERQLDRRVHGHRDAKGHVVRLIAQWVTNPDAKGLVIGVHGHPGLGKTELCKAVCETLGLPFAFVPLGGANDGSYLDGHSYTYEGATWGKIADVLMKCRAMNPVLFFDELDKVSESRKGEEIINLLIHLTDPTQNDRFNDKYFLDVELDLSKCLCIFSYNDETRISPVLRDRMVRVHTEGYALRDKLRIARDHLIPRTLAEFRMRPDEVRIGDVEIARVVETVEEEQGVRNLKRGLHDVVSCIHFERKMGRLPMPRDAEAPAGEGGGGAEETPHAIEVTAAQIDKYVKSGRRDAPGSSAWKDASRMAMYR